MRTLTHFCFLLALFAFACNGGGDAAAADATEETEAEAPTPAPITVDAMPATTSFPDAKINDFSYQDSTFSFDVSGYEFGVQTPDATQLMCANSEKGQHIHLIMDNGPYMAKYEPEFKQAIEDGEHYMLAFLSRSYHLSIKNPDAARVAKVTAEGGTFTATEEVSEPMLFYSRPKGTYRGKKATENIMLDFYPVNAPLSDGYQVKADINGEEFTLTEWKPYYIKGLPFAQRHRTSSTFNSTFFQLLAK